MAYRDNEKRRKWYADNQHKCRKNEATYRLNLRLEMVAAYGGQCCKCGESDFVVLVLDHIEDDARTDRKENNHNGGWRMYSRLRKLGWPQGRYQLLCHNCNFRKEYYRRTTCPAKVKLKSV